MYIYIYIIGMYIYIYIYIYIHIHTYIMIVIIRPGETRRETRSDGSSCGDSSPRAVRAIASGYVTSGEVRACDDRA